MQTVNMLWLEEHVKSKYNLEELEIDNLYKVSDIMIETPSGFKDTIGFIKKRGKKAIVEFESGVVHRCLHNHMYIPPDARVVYARDLMVGDKILTKDGLTDSVKSVDITDEDMIAYDISVDALDGIYVTADGIQHHNTGKTQTVEDVLAQNGLKDGNGYFKNTGTASAPGIYTLLYRHKKDIVLFDDSDGALGDQDARNILKAATDTKPSRKIAWGKKASFIFDPEEEHPAVYANDLTMAPSHYFFKGRIIFISNLTLDKLDPDGALRTRAFIINVNPTQEEIFQYMEKILMKIKLEGGAVLNQAQRMEVLDVIKSSKKKDDATLRTLVRALNLAASGAPNWPLLVRLYS